MAVNAVLSLSDEERAWAVRVIAAMEGSGSASVAVDGRMVDRPVCCGPCISLLGRRSSCQGKNGLTPAAAMRSVRPSQVAMAAFV